MNEPAELPRRLGLTDASSIVAGVMIGAGIFLVPSLVAKNLPSPAWMLAAWAFAGLLSFTGALALAELGAMMPATGGMYVFLREAYGPLIAFLCGWTSFFASHSAAIAWLGVSFSLYLGYFIPLSPVAAKIVGIVLIGVIAAINYRGVTLGAGVQKIFTAGKILGLGVLIVSAFLPVAHAASPQPAVAVTWSAFGVALIACLLSFDGWTSVSSVAGEIRDPSKNVLRALALGVLVVIIVYLSVNYAYLRVMTPVEMAASPRIGAELGQRTLGPFGGTLVSLTILISIIGGLNGWIMTQPRVYFAQARDGLFFRKFAEIHPRYRTPGFSIVMQSVWSSVLILTGSFEILISYAMFAIWLFYVLTGASVIVLRIKRQELPRPYRMFGYPVTPALFTVVAAWFVINTMIEQPQPSLIALGIILAGVPVFWFWRRGRMTPALAAAPGAE